MADEFVSLDPTLPLCWETTETLRFGFERAEVRLCSPSPAAQRFLALLRRGVRAKDLDAMAGKSGLSSTDQQELLRRLAPALLYSAGAAPLTHSGPQRTAAAALRVKVLGQGPFAHAVRGHLGRAGFTVTADASRPEAAILVECFLGRTNVAQTLLCDDVPHLPIRLSERHLVLGPLVPPGGRPCLSCVDLHALQAEPLLRVLAAQLADRTPAAASPVCAEIASSLAIAALTQYWCGQCDLVGVRLHFPVRHGLPSPIPLTERVLPHPECGCVQLTDSGGSSAAECQPSLSQEA